MKRKSAKELTVTTGPPTRAEIMDIKREHRFIVEAGFSMVSRAMNIGDWFIACQQRVQEGDWQRWLKTEFPNISVRQIQRYVQLAEHRQFLETKFNLNKRLTESSSSADLERVTSIRECLKAIAELNAPRRKKDKSTIGGQRKAIDVETTITPSHNNGEYGRPMKIGVDVETQLALTTDIRSREPLESEPAKSAKEIVAEQVEAYIRLQSQANEVLHEIAEWVEREELSAGEVLDLIKSACRYRPEMALGTLTAIEKERLHLHNPV